VTQKCSNLKIRSPASPSFKIFLNAANPLNKLFYSTFSAKDSNDANKSPIDPAVVYKDALLMKKEIIKENKGKAGIYMWTNKLTGDIYVGQSVDLSKRFRKYFSLSYIESRNELIISRALIKYGYSNFSLAILEYCNESELDIKEQYYFDTLNPQYNIQKISGGSSKGIILSKETKAKISKSLKGVYTYSFLPQFRLYIPAIRNYSSQSDANGLHNTPRSRILAHIIGKNPIFYDDSLNLKKVILGENKGKSGIYMWTNKITGDIYIGQAVDLANRLKSYFHQNYLEKNKSFLISRALMKYGHSSFSLTILEYCDKSELNEREQYYLDNLEPDYNILKNAASFLGYTFTEEAKAKISKALKGINRSEETKELMREKAFGRKHSEDTKLKMSMSSPRGNPVNVYEKYDSSGFKLIGSFVSARRAAVFFRFK
jgi:group I intron endonuclease